MRGPDKIKVGPHVYRVTYSAAVELCGNTQFEHNAIGICSNQSPSQIRDTLCHEITHVILETLKLDDEVKEQVCMVMGPGLLQVLVDNPELYPYLTTKEKQR